MGSASPDESGLPGISTLLELDPQAREAKQ